MFEKLFRYYTWFAIAAVTTSVLYTDDVNAEELREFPAPVDVSFSMPMPEGEEEENNAFYRKWVSEDELEVTLDNENGDAEDAIRGKVRLTIYEYKDPAGVPTNADLFDQKSRDDMNMFSQLLIRGHQGVEYRKQPDYGNDIEVIGAYMVIRRFIYELEYEPEEGFQDTESVLTAWRIIRNEVKLNTPENTLPEEAKNWFPNEDWNAEEIRKKPDSERYDVEFPDEVYRRLVFSGYGRLPQLSWPWLSGRDYLMESHYSQSDKGLIYGLEEFRIVGGRMPAIGEVVSREMSLFDADDLSFTLEFERDKNSPYPAVTRTLKDAEGNIRDMSKIWLVNNSIFELSLGMSSGSEEADNEDFLNEWERFVGTFQLKE